ncbi:MAG: diguanylate cyclase domain-containing protein, partial [Anaerolineae bacterium]
MTTSTAHRVAQLTRQIARLQAEIADLGWDTNFAMLTRNAFLRRCCSLKDGVRRVAFVDLNAIHTQNLLYGYAEVDERVRAAFDLPWRNEHTVARWFSGDEIAVLFDESADAQAAEACMLELEASAGAQVLGLAWDTGSWDVSVESIEEAMARLSEEVRRRAIKEASEAGAGRGEAAIADAELATLPRRRGMVERMQRLLGQGQVAIVLIYGDLDQLGHINAIHGRQSGDLAMLAVLRAIREEVPDALIARESSSYLICLEDTSLEDGFLRAEAIRSAVAALPPLTVGGESTPLHLSAGVAALPRHAASARELCRHAEEALFRAQADGGNCVRLAQPQTMVAKTSHYGPEQLTRLAALAEA